MRDSYRVSVGLLYIFYMSYISKIFRFHRPGKIGKHHSMQCTSFPINKKTWKMESPAMFLLRLLFLRLCLPKCLHVLSFKTKQSVKLATIFFHPEKLGKVATTFRTFSERCVQCIQNPKQRWWKCAAKTSLF